MVQVLVSINTHFISNFQCLLSVWRHYGFVKEYVIRLKYLSLLLMSLKTNTYTLPSKKIFIKIILVLLTLITFLFGIDLMVTSFNLLNDETMRAIAQATANPFTALFIGLLVTAIIQSSSATTSMVVALVAAGSVSFESAVPLIMGANIGTTITSTFVSIGFISLGKEYKRAVAASTSHDFFNILTVAILFPLEYYFNFLSGLSRNLTDWIFDPASPKNTVVNKFFGNPLSEFLVNNISNELVLVAISFLLLLLSIILFRNIIANWLGVQQSKAKLFFKNPVYTFFGGLISTALIRSSTITTSLVVPLVAKNVIKLRAAFLFILGANIGTTITAFIAAFSNSHSAISIAITHLLFNCIGVIIFILPGVMGIPIFLAKGLGQLSYKHRFAIVVYLLLIFFIIPFSLILINK